MATQPIFSFELIDNKIPCGGFNLLGGGVKGRNIESKESQSLIFSLYKDTRADTTVTPQRLLTLNYEDFVRIRPILENPPSGQEVVATNLRFTCWDYYDYLQMYSNVKTPSMEEIFSVVSKATNGNIVTLYDIANLYTKELGIKTVSKNDKGNIIDNLVEKILIQYYQLGNVLFDDWVKKATAWCDPMTPFLNGIDQSGSGDSFFARFVLSFTEEGNTLTHIER